MKEDKNLDDFLPDKKASYSKLLDKDISSDKKIIKEDVIKCISTVMDPEIPVNVYDLGLIYSIIINNNNVTIDMTLTNPNCPVAGEIPQNVGKSVEVLENLKSIQVNLVWSPPWSENMMSEDAKLALDIF